VTERRGFVKEAATAVGLVLMVGLVFIASLALSTGLRLAADVVVPGTGSTIGSLPLIFPIVGLVLPYAVAFGLFTFIYKIVPHRHMTWRQVWPGAMVASILFEIGKQLFAWYLSTFANFSLVYGSIGAVIALVTWSYYAAIVLLVGAVLNAVLTRQSANAAGSGRPSEVDRRRDAA
jgi:membrane protein